MKVMSLSTESPSVEQSADVDDDDRLVRQARKRPSHFAVLYNRHVTNVYRYLLSRTGNQADAEDLTSQTFLEAMEKLDRYRGDGNFQAWLFRIARNKSIDHYRKHKRLTWLAEEREIEDTTQGSLDTQVSHTLQLDAVLGQLGNLAPDRAEVISLRLFGQLETAEIAQLMDKSETAVRMLLHRGIRDLQSRLNPTAQECGQ